MSVALQTVVNDQPFTVLLTADTVRERLQGLVLDSATIIVTSATQEDLVVLEAAIMQLRKCWSCNLHE